MSRQTIILIFIAAVTILIVSLLRACQNRSSQGTSPQTIGSVQPLRGLQVIDSTSQGLAEEWLQHDCVLDETHPIELELQSFARPKDLESLFLEIYRHGPDSATVVVPYLDEMSYVFDQRRAVLARDTG